MTEINCPICNQAITTTHRMQQLDTQLTYHIRKHGLTIKEAKHATRKAFNPELYQDDKPVKPIDSKPQSKPIESQTIESQTKPVITHNNKLNGIEVKFQSKPDDTILTILRDLGFRWSYKSMLWYARYSDDLMAKVQTQIS